MSLAHALEEPPAPGSSYPRLRIAARDVVWIKGDQYLAQSRHDFSWLLVKLATNEPALMSDDDLLVLYGTGQLKWRSRPTKHHPLSPLSPAVMTKSAQADALRKHEYVQYVCQHPDGYRTTKSWIKARIAEKAPQLSDRQPPSPGSVITWKRLHDAYFEEVGLAAYAVRHDLKGKRGSRLLPIQQEAIERSVDRFLQGGSIEDALIEAKKFIHDFNQSAEGKRYCQVVPTKFLRKDGTLGAPCLSTLRREISLKLSPFVIQAGRVGRHSARKKFTTYQTRRLPQRPYEEVEVDFTPMDVRLVAENHAVLGRPYLVVLLDRATRMVLGFSISFDVPTYAAVVDGIKNATYRKQISHIQGLRDEDWPCMGRIERIFIDNGLEFANNHLRSAATQLGFEIVRLPPRAPWLKGLVERFMREAARFAHRLPGTTHSNAVQHREFEDADLPILTLSELRDLVTKWIVTVYNAQPNRMLGNAPGVSRAPIDAWRDKLDDYDVPSLPDKKLFIALAGEHEERTVQKYGVEWDHIRYWSPALDRILAHPDHRLKSSGKGAAKYHVHRDPYDLSKIYLHSRHAEEIIELPAVQKWAEYTDGLTAFQHRLCRQHELVREEQRSDPIALMNAKADLIKASMGALQSGRRKTIERTLVRHLYGNRSHLLHAEVATNLLPDVGHEPISLSPTVPMPALIVEKASGEIGQTPFRAELAPTVLATLNSDPDDMAEIEELATSIKSGVRTDV